MSETGSTATAAVEQSGWVRYWHVVVYLSLVAATAVADADADLSSGRVIRLDAGQIDVAYAAQITFEQTKFHQVNAIHFHDALRHVAKRQWEDKGNHIFFHRCRRRIAGS